MKEQLNISITPFTSEIIGANSKFLFIKEQDVNNDEWYVLRVELSELRKIILHSSQLRHGGHRSEYPD